MRIDPEFYQPHLLTYERELAQSGLSVVPLGSLAIHGYRVIYENTEIIEEPEDVTRYVRFLQAAQLESGFPSISHAALGWVSRSDWNRYPQGRIRPGEILIEVKGSAEKVAIVPEDFPNETLVTGTLFKLTANSALVDSHYLLSYLLSKYGKGFRERCLTNTLIGFVSKEELYAIPVPLPPKSVQKRIGDTVRKAIAQHSAFIAGIRDAETLVADTLGLHELDTTPTTTYSRKFSDLNAANRFGAEYFMPSKQRALDALASKSSGTLSEHYSSVRKLFDAADADPGDSVRNFDLTEALEPVLDDRVPPMLAGEVGSIKKYFETNDVVISRLRSYLKEIALVRTSDTTPSVGSSEFIVLRSRVQNNALTPEALLIYLRSLPVQTVLKWSQDGSQHPRFNEADLLAIPVPIVILKMSHDLRHLVNRALEARSDAITLLDNAQAEIERLVYSE
jgi:type I restriction enzyme S subunit